MRLRENEFITDGARRKCFSKNVTRIGTDKFSFTAFEAENFSSVKYRCGLFFLKEERQREYFASNGMRLHYSLPFYFAPINRKLSTSWKKNCREWLPLSRHPLVYQGPQCARMSICFSSACVRISRGTNLTFVFLSRPR